MICHQKRRDLGCRVRNIAEFSTWQISVCCSVRLLPVFWPRAADNTVLPVLFYECKQCTDTSMKHIDSHPSQIKMTIRTRSMQCRGLRLAHVSIRNAHCAIHSLLYTKSMPATESRMQSAAKKGVHHLWQCVHPRSESQSYQWCPGKAEAAHPCPVASRQSQGCSTGDPSCSSMRPMQHVSSAMSKQVCDVIRGRCRRRKEEQCR